MNRNYLFKAVLSLAALFHFSGAIAQKEIAVTKNSTILLIFPEPVANHILGNALEYIVYENDKPDLISKKILKLGYNINGRGSSKTNLSVVTEDGLLYEFILNYTESIPTLMHRLSKTDASVNLAGDTPGTGSASEPTGENTEKPAAEIVRAPASAPTETTHTKVFDRDKLERLDPATIATDELYTSDKEAYIYLQCKNSLDRKQGIARTFAKAYNVILRLRAVHFDKDELYLYLTLENGGAQAYEVDFIKFAIATVKKGKRSDQEPPHIPPYIYNAPKRVEGIVNHDFVVVFDKFPLSRNKQLWVEIREKNGERNTILKIDHQLINNPRKF